MRKVTTMSPLSNVKVAVIATNQFEDSELTGPVEAVRERGATVSVLSTEAGTIEGKNGTSITVDGTTADADPAEFDALILPSTRRSTRTTDLAPPAPRPTCPPSTRKSWRSSPRAATRPASRALPTGWSRLVA